MSIVVVNFVSFGFRELPRVNFDADSHAHNVEPIRFIFLMFDSSLSLNQNLGDFLTKNIFRVFDAAAHIPTRCYLVFATDSFTGRAPFPSEFSGKSSL